MSTALVVGNGQMLVNINDRLQVTDLYFPTVGQENHLSNFSNKMFFRINGSFVYLNQHNFDFDINYSKDSLVGISKITHKNTGLIFEFKDFISTNKLIFFRNIRIINKTQNKFEIYVYFQNNFTIYENDIGDTTVWHHPTSSLIHYKKDRYISVGSTKTIYQFTCAGRMDNNNLGAYPNQADGQLYMNPISNGSVNSCISHRIHLKANSEEKIDHFYACGYNIDDIQKNIDWIRTIDSEKEFELTEKYWSHWVLTKTDHLFGKKTTEHIKIIEDKEHTHDLNYTFFGDKELDAKLNRLYKRSLLTVRSQIDNGGAITAANDGKFLKEGGKDTYSYFWPRDGAAVIMALIDCGFKELSDQYFEYAHKLITPEGYFMHKYYPSSGYKHNIIGSSWHPWVDKCGNYQLPIQEDETALNIIAAWKHYKEFGDQEFLNKYWDNFIFPMVNFITNYRYTVDYPNENIAEYVSGFVCEIDSNNFDSKFSGSKLPRPSYDLWEEYRGIHTYTCSTVYAAFLAASKLCIAYGKDDYSKILLNFANDTRDAMLKHLVNKEKSTFISRALCDELNNCVISNQIDSSVYAVWRFEVLDIKDPLVKNTMKEVEKTLKVESEIGGIARKENDYYSRIDKNLAGNPWFICTLWLAQYYIRLGKKEKAKEYIEWAVRHTDLTGLMAEQAHPHFGYGVSVKPLTWSHAEFINTMNMMIED